MSSGPDRPPSEAAALGCSACTLLPATSAAALGAHSFSAFSPPAQPPTRPPGSRPWTSREAPAAWRRLVASDMGPSYGMHHAPEAYWGPPQYTCPCRRTPSRAWRTRERWRKRRGGYGRSVSLLEATRGATRSPPQRCLQALSDPGARARQCMFTRGRRRSARSGSGCTASCTHRLARDLPWHRRAAAQGRATSGAGAATKAMALWNRPCERASDGQKSRPLEFRM